MIRLAIAVMGGIVMYISAANGDWGPFAIALVITVCLLAMGSAERKESRAWWNAVDYWSKDGKDRYLTRKRWREEAEREERRARERDAEKKKAEAAHRADRLIAQMQAGNRSVENWITCPKCNTVMQTLSKRVIRNGNEMSEYICRECGYRELKKN